VYTNPSVFTSSIFDELRERVPLDSILDVNGHRKAACVDHDDRTPSMHVYGDRVHCFACGFHGDVTDVWAKMRGIADPIEAALDLARDWGIRLPELSAE